MWSPTVRLFGVPVPVGGVVGVPIVTRIGRVDHKGVVTDRYGRVVETEASDFAARAVGPVRFVGYLGNLSPDEVLRRARAKIGARYRPLAANCEHFATGVHGLPPESPQLRGLALLGIVSAVAVGAIVVAASVDGRL
jgi:hypothetical protein